MQNKRIVIIDDEEILRITLADDLREIGYTVTDFGDPKQAVAMILSEPPDIVITDLKMPGMSGLEVLEDIKKNVPFVKTIVMTAFGSVETAVEAMKLGASDYITKPFQADEVFIRVNNLAQISSLEQTNRRFQEIFQTQFDFGVLVGDSIPMQKVKQQIQMVAKTNSTVLITGETGTGKEMVANVIHYNSERAKKPLVKVSCAILARDVFESELFGHEKGAFTGAIKSRSGRFELAHSGAIYLDDVDDIPLEMQVKLLRVLQEKQVERVGASEPISVDVRVIASTKADLKDLAARGVFREDLYYRLNVFPIHLPPLRQRKEDIWPLIQHFQDEFCNDCRLSMTDGVKAALLDYDWPGNVRELKNIVERLTISSGCSICDESMLPTEILGGRREQAVSQLGEKTLDKIMADMECELLIKALRQSNGSQKDAAALLRIPASTFRTKIAKYRLNK
ncbi:MAG: sigma-54-dependent Fis family transcriptional regulator [Calditrichaeota bacterium]|nr:sigma-54-dependent Fis family transcriptional regulator [Calditrichota bacterium]